MATSPFVAPMIAVAFVSGGLLGFGGEESEWLVSGVRPFKCEAFLLCAKACEFELNTEEAVLASELAEPTPRRVSPESDGCISSESGDRYCVVVWPLTLVPCERRDPVNEVELLSLTVFVPGVGEERVCVKPPISRFRLRVPGDTLLLTASRPPPLCDMMSPAPQAILMGESESRRGWRSCGDETATAEKKMEVTRKATHAT